MPIKRMTIRRVGLPDEILVPDADGNIYPSSSIPFGEKYETFTLWENPKGSRKQRRSQRLGVKP